MKALRIDAFGPVTALAVTEMPAPVRRPDEVLIEVRAASISPFDVRNVTGLVPLITLPRVPGRDYAGVVVDGPPALLGREVWGSGGSLGLTRDGSHAQYLTIPVNAVREKPGRLGFPEAAAIGVSYSAAWIGLSRAARVSAGEVVLIVGASGSVGRAAAQIARWRGARVIGADRRPTGDGTVDHQVNTTTQDLTKTVLELTNGRGADVVFDTVGGPRFGETLGSLRHRGRPSSSPASASAECRSISSTSTTRNSRSMASIRSSTISRRPPRSSTSCASGSTRPCSRRQRS